MYLKDPHAHWDMIEGLESRYRVEECSFETIFGSFHGHRIYASRKVLEKIEKQTRYAWMSGRISGIWPKGLFPCGNKTSPGSLPISKFL